MRTTFNASTTAANTTHGALSFIFIRILIHLAILGWSIHSSRIILHHHVRILLRHLMVHKAKHLIGKRLTSSHLYVLWNLADIPSILLILRRIHAHTATHVTTIVRHRSSLLKPVTLINWVRISSL
jgi:hypothetical protein